MNIHAHKGFNCCGKTLHSRASLKYHIKTYHVLKCPICEKQIADGRGLLEHMEEHEAMRVKTEMETEGSIEVEMEKEVEVKMEEGVK